MTLLHSFLPCTRLFRVRRSHSSIAYPNVLAVLDKMRSAGYVHRDVSLGNIMLQCMDTSSTNLSERFITKLADLEYARAYDKIANDRGVVCLLPSVPLVT